MYMPLQCFDASKFPSIIVFDGFASVKASRSVRYSDPYAYIEYDGVGYACAGDFYNETTRRYNVPTHVLMESIPYLTACDPEIREREAELVGGSNPNPTTSCTYPTHRLLFNISVPEFYLSVVLVNVCDNDEYTNSVNIEPITSLFCFHGYETVTRHTSSYVVMFGGTSVLPILPPANSLPYSSSNPYARILSLSYEGESSGCSRGPCPTCNGIVISEFSPHIVRRLSTNTNITMSICGCCLTWMLESDNTLRTSNENLYDELEVTMVVSVGGQDLEYDMKFHLKSFSFPTIYDQCLRLDYDADIGISGFPVCDRRDGVLIGNIRVNAATDRDGRRWEHDELVDKGVISNDYRDNTVYYYNRFSSEQIEISIGNPACSIEYVDIKVTGCECPIFIDEAYLWSKCSKGYSSPVVYNNISVVPGDVIGFSWCCPERPDKDSELGGYLIVGGKRHMFVQKGETLYLGDIETQVCLFMRLEFWSTGYGSVLCCKGDVVPPPDHLNTSVTYSKSDGSSETKRFSIAFDDEGWYSGCVSVPCSVATEGRLQFDFSDLGNHCLFVSVPPVQEQCSSGGETPEIPEGTCSWYCGTLSPVEGFSITFNYSVHFDDSVPMELRDGKWIDAAVVTSTAYATWHQPLSEEFASKTNCGIPDCNPSSKPPVVDAAVLLPDGREDPLLVARPGSRWCTELWVSGSSVIFLHEDVRHITVYLNGGHIDSDDSNDSETSASSQGEYSVYARRGDDISDKKRIPTRDGYRFVRFDLADAPPGIDLDEDGWPTVMPDANITLETVWEADVEIAVSLGFPRTGSSEEAGSPYGPGEVANCPDTASGRIFSVDGKAVELEFHKERGSTYVARGSVETTSPTNDDLRFEFDGNEYVEPETGVVSKSSIYIGAGTSYFRQPGH